MEDVIKFVRYDQEDKTTEPMEFKSEDLHNFLLLTMETYLTNCRDDIKDRTSEETKQIIDRWDKKFANDDPIKGAVSDNGEFLEIRLSIFDKIEIVLSADLDHRSGKYEHIEIIRILCPPDYLEFGYQIVNAIDHVAWVFGSSIIEYAIINPDLLEVGLLYYNGYEKKVVNPDNEIYLVKYQIRDYGYIIRNEGEESNAPAEG